MDAPPIHRKRRPFPLDWTLALPLLGLMVIGVLFIHSARLATEAPLDLAWYQRLAFKQIIWYAIGCGAFAAVCLLDYKSLSRWSYVFYWGSILLLVAVLIPFIGASRFGARRWIDLGPFSLQPSEVAKLAFILALAHFLSRPLDELRQPGVFGRALGMLAIPFLLIFIEPDLGSALVLIPVGLAMMYVGGIPPQYLRRLLYGSGLLVGLVVLDVLFAPPNWRVPIQDYQRRRLLVYFDRDYRNYAPPDAGPAELKRAREQQRNDSYNVRQALISVGSGGLTGKGWREGTQNSLGYLPRAVAHNDFVFAVLAEESGFVGSTVVVSLYSVVFLAGLRIAARAGDRLGRLVAVGVVVFFFSHVFINIGMNIRLMPVTGVPLPLLSYGGSSVLVTLLAAGLLQNVHMHRRT